MKKAHLWSYPGSRQLHAIGRLVLMIVFLLGLTIVGTAQAPAVEDEPDPSAVVHQGERLIIFYATVHGLTPDQRRERTSQVIRQLAEDPDFEPGLIRLSDTPDGTSIIYKNNIIATVSIEDAKISHSRTRLMASKAAAKIRRVLAGKMEEFTAARFSMAVGITLLGGFLLLLIVAVVLRTGHFVSAKMEHWRGSRIKDVKIQDATLISSDMLANLCNSVNTIFQTILIMLSVFAYVLVVLESFPQTRSIGISMKETAVNPLILLSEHFFDYLPNLFAIIVLATITYGAIAFVRFVFDALEAGTISISGFEREWSRPTYKIVRALIVLIFLVLALPYAPGWESESFKQVGLLFGLLLSLGSTSVVGQIMAGTVLTYTNAFKIGDRVSIGGRRGDVLDKTMFVTRIKTVKNEVVSIPNAEILNSHIVNYSKMANIGELILHTEVTIGYDVPWREAEKLLIEAAKATKGIAHDPTPFVLKKELADFAISYELNTYTSDASHSPRIYSALHENIIDRFHEAGVEIMSPNFLSLRDGNRIQIPDGSLPEGYSTSPFKVMVDSGKRK